MCNKHMHRCVDVKATTENWRPIKVRNGNNFVIPTKFQSAHVNNAMPLSKFDFYRFGFICFSWIIVWKFLIFNTRFYPIKHRKQINGNYKSRDFLSNHHFLWLLVWFLIRQNRIYPVSAMKTLHLSFCLWVFDLL